MNYWYFTAASLVFFGFALFFYLSTRKKYRDPSAAQNYEKVRNKVTVREPEVEEEDDGDYVDTGYSLSVGSIISVGITLFITIIIGFTMIGPITDQVNLAINMTSSSSSYSNNISNAGYELNSMFTVATLELVPSFFALMILLTAVIMIVSAVNRIRSSSDDFEEEDKPIKHYTKMRDKLSTRS